MRPLHCEAEALLMKTACRRRWRRKAAASPGAPRPRPRPRAPCPLPPAAAPRLRGGAGGVGGGEAGGVLAKGQVCNKGGDVDRFDAPAWFGGWHGTAQRGRRSGCGGAAAQQAAGGGQGGRGSRQHGERSRAGAEHAICSCKPAVQQVCAPTCRPRPGSSPPQGRWQPAPARRQGSAGGAAATNKAPCTGAVRQCGAGESRAWRRRCGPARHVLCKITAAAAAAGRQAPCCTPQPQPP